MAFTYLWKTLSKSRAFGDFKDHNAAILLQFIFFSFSFFIKLLLGFINIFSLGVDDITDSNKRLKFYEIMSISLLFVDILPVTIMLILHLLNYKKEKSQASFID